MCERGSVVVTSAEVCEGVNVGQLVVKDVIVEQPVVSGVDSPCDAFPSPKLAPSWAKSLKLQNFWDSGHAPTSSTKRG